MRITIWTQILLIAMGNAVIGFLIDEIEVVSFSGVAQILIEFVLLMTYLDMYSAYGKLLKSLEQCRNRLIHLL